MIIAPIPSIRSVLLFFDGFQLSAASFSMLTLLAIQREAFAPENARYTSAYDRIEGRKLRLVAARVAAEKTSDQPSATSSQEMPPDGWLCELTLAIGPDADVRPGVPSTTPWRASDKVRPRLSPLMGRILGERELRN